MHAYIFVVVNFDALAQPSDFWIERRQVVFLCWRQDSNPEGLRHLFASRLNACWQTDRAIEDQAKNLNSTARPYDQQAFSPPDPTAIWHSHLALAIYIFVVVNFDALAQASDLCFASLVNICRGVLVITFNYCVRNLHQWTTKNVTSHPAIKTYFVNFLV